MRTTLQLGAHLNTLDSDELRAELERFQRSWITEIYRGTRYPRFRASGTVAADGTLSIAPGVDNRLGPVPSVVWSVKGICVSGLSTGQFVDMTINGHDFVRSFPYPAAGQGDLSTEKFGSNQLVLYDSDHLEFTGASLTVGAIIVVSGRTEEVPIELIGRL